jgi:glycosyltransferase involved in cell wall biosynthesis
VKVLIEAMCAEFGGIRTYVENLLQAWPEVFPEDEVHVLVRAGSTLPVPDSMHRHDAPVGRPDVLTRPLAQTRWVRRLERRLRPDAVLATLPSTTVRRTSAPMATVVYDLRHELRPEQFTRFRRALRSVSYNRGYAVSDGVIAISQRSLDDLHRLHERTTQLPSVVAHLGADHVDAWSVDASDAGGHAITFAHHTNKILDLVLDGWRDVVDAVPDAPPLHILGLGAARRADVTLRLEALGLSDAVKLAPFLPEDEFRTALATAGLVLFPSDFEGFGLPVAEAMRLHIPVVIGPEEATMEVAGGHAVVMSDWTPAALAASVGTALELGKDQLDQAAAFAARYTWEQTVQQTRAMLGRLTARA